VFGGNAAVRVIGILCLGVLGGRGAQISGTWPGLRIAESRWKSDRPCWVNRVVIKKKGCWNHKCAGGPGGT